jgi:hypothetical protein
MDEDRLFLRSSERPGAKRQSAEAEFIMGQIARLPTRWELTKYAFVILAVRAVLGIVGIETFWHYMPVCAN